MELTPDIERIATRFGQELLAQVAAGRVFAWNAATFANRVACEVKAEVNKPWNPQSTLHQEVMRFIWPLAEVAECMTHGEEPGEWWVVNKKGDQGWSAKKFLTRHNRDLWLKRNDGWEEIAAEDVPRRFKGW